MIPLRLLGDVDALDASLALGGLQPAARVRVGRLFGRLAQHLLSNGHTEETSVYAFFIPGRIEVLGKHTDYAGGQSLVGAVPRGFCVLAVAGEGPALRVTDVARGKEALLSLEDTSGPIYADWTRYLGAVVQRVSANFPGANKGGEVVLMSNLPSASGMSSSSALVVGLFLALAALNNLPDHPAYQQNITSPFALAEYMSALENGKTYNALQGQEGAGTLGGSQDHMAILHSQAGALQHFAYAPAKHLKTLPWPDGFQWVIAASGVQARKAGAAKRAYNLAAQRAAAVAQAWRTATAGQEPHMAAVLSHNNYHQAHLLEALKTHTPEGFDAGALRVRLKHFLIENEEVLPMAIDAYEKKDWTRFGDAVDRSQEAARHLLGNQVPQTVLLGRAARALGAIAATSFGAGYGGAVWAMVKREDVHEFLHRWQAQYGNAFPGQIDRASFFATDPGPPVFQLQAA